MTTEDTFPPTTPAGVHDLRWVALSVAAQASGKSERQLQRWAAKDKSLVRRRERGHTVEYCLDDVLAVVGRAPAQQRIAQHQRRIAELERVLTEMEGALADAQARSRTQRITLQRIKARHKRRCTAKEAQIAALYTLITTLQDEIIRLRVARMPWWWRWVGQSRRR